MNWTCPNCGSQMFLVANCGEFFLRCPREHDGYHPQIVTFTTNSTMPVDLAAVREADAARRKWRKA